MHAEDSRPTETPFQIALRWLYGTGMFGIKLGLENIQRLTRDLGVETRGFATIFHIAGTNGKGSVCAMIERICREHGLRTGLYTSPHLVTCRERICVNGEIISPDDFVEGISAIRAATEEWEHVPTFFEVVTAMALRHFQRHSCDVVIMETGMGGRLDATNAVTPSVSVITPISFDHEKWLGNTLAQIAAEKAGIIKEGVPVVSAKQEAEADAVLNEVCEQKGVRLTFANRPWSGGPVALAGEHQLSNAALAVEAIRAAGLDIPLATVQRGLSQVEWRARFQQLNPRLFIDGAHNPAAAQALVKTWKGRFGCEKPAVVFAALSDKDVPGICESLVQIAGSFAIAPVKNPRTALPETLQMVIKGLAPDLECTLYTSTTAALEAALDRTTGKVLAAGSLYLAGEILAALDPRIEPDMPAKF